MNYYTCIIYRVFPRLISRGFASDAGGIKCHGFTYYPRFPDHEDPPFEPPKLFLVKRIKHIKGNPYWDKQILKTFGLYSWKGHPSVVVKNIPEVNARLWKIKHLVEITPITFPQGPPQDGDYGGTFLKENGEFVVSPRLQVDSARIEETAKFIGDESKMDGPTLKKQLRLRWLNPFNLD